MDTDTDLGLSVSGSPDVSRETGKVVLDACCGGRMMWFDRANPLAVFVDKRKETLTLCDGRILDVNPDVIADFTNLPFDDETFHLVVFDPPHLTTLGTDTSWLAQKYGRLIGDWKDMLTEGFKECFRVLKTNGTLIFKWSEYDVPLATVLALAPQEPLFGSNAIGGSLRSRSHWLCYFKNAPPVHNGNDATTASGKPK